MESLEGFRSAIELRPRKRNIYVIFSLKNTTYMLYYLITDTNREVYEVQRVPAVATCPVPFDHKRA